VDTTEFVAVVTGASTLLAGGGSVWLRSALDRRAVRRRVRLEAYERLVTAVRILELRSTADRMQRTLRWVAAETMWEQGKFIPMVLVMSSPRLRKRLGGVSGVASLFDAIPTPHLEQPPVTDTSLQSAYDEVTAAEGGVRLHGSKRVGPKAEHLLDVSREYVKHLSVPPWRKGRMTGRQLNGHVLDLERARDEYLRAVRCQRRSNSDPLTPVEN